VTHVGRPSPNDTGNVFPTFTDLPGLHEHGPTTIARGEGVYVFDTEGRRYLEGNAGLWNMTLGFSEGRLVEAARLQYAALPGYHTFFGRVSPAAAALAERVVDLAPVPMSRAFFTNSGSEANDSAAKLLWMIWAAEGQPQRRKFISRLNAYHGATVLGSSLTGKTYSQAFGLPRSEIVMVECPHPYRGALPGESDDAFCKRLAVSLEMRILAEDPETIAGFFAEPVMGAGGVIVPPSTYFARIQPVLRKYEIPIVGDEVICGFGRTGRLWGAEAVGQMPDILVASKSISAGYFPMGAVLLSREIDERLTDACRVWEEFPHGFTTGGHPVGCAISLEAIRIIVDGGILDHVRAIAPLFATRLRELGDHPLIGETRGIGLMGGLEIVENAATRQSFPAVTRIGERIARAAQQRGLIVRPLGSSVVLAPPFIINEAELEEMFSILADVLDAVQRDLPADRRAASSEPEQLRAGRVGHG
jgi:4-aminobutyrate---pyruvate transaminase